jgi:hypothetical protein
MTPVPNGQQVGWGSMGGGGGLPLRSTTSVTTLKETRRVPICTNHLHKELIQLYIV